MYTSLHLVFGYRNMLAIYYCLDKKAEKQSRVELLLLIKLFKSFQNLIR